MDDPVLPDNNGKPGRQFQGCQNPLHERDGTQVSWGCSWQAARRIRLPVHGQSSGVEASKSCRGNLQKSRKEWRKSLAWTLGLGLRVRIRVSLVVRAIHEGACASSKVRARVKG